MAKRVGKKNKNISRVKNSQNNDKKVSRDIAIVALILNILVLPGVGTIVGGRNKTGIWQIVLAIIGIILSFVLIGIPLIIGVWIWGIFTGIDILKHAKKN